MPDIFFCWLIKPEKFPIEKNMSGCDNVTSVAFSSRLFQDG